jgi:CRISPR-associated protein Cmr3
MSSYLIEPRDPLIVRDGRPMFAGMPQMRSLDFPLPSTLAGLARTRAGAGDDGRFDHSQIAALRTLAVRGPWLVTLDANGNATENFWPAPRDGVWSGGDEDAAGTDWNALRPHPGDADVTTDLERGLELIGFESTPPESKAGPCAPAFWSWPAIAAWLRDRQKPTQQNVLEPLIHERRMHVAIDPNTGTAVDGALFATDGLRFWRRMGQTEVRTALAFQTDAERFGLELATLGGERRLSHVRAYGGGLPTQPPGLKDKLAGESRARVLMATPACFPAGSASESVHGQKVVAVCVGRPDIMSGWDMEKCGPKPTRRLVPAGSVYWVELPNSSEARADWLARAWAQPASEQAEQDRVDGFGMTFVGVM